MENYYFSDKLKRKAEKIRSTSTAVVEAPSGYGKTTLIRDYFLGQLPKDAQVYWFTSVEELPVSAYKRLCINIEKIDSDVGRRLLQFELPNAATIGSVTDALRSIRCLNETYLVINPVPDAKDIMEHYSFFYRLQENYPIMENILDEIRFLSRVLLKEVTRV